MSRYSIEDLARFAEGDMTEEESLEFSAALQTDPELEQRFQDYRNIESSLRMKLVEDDQDIALKESLSSLNKQHFNAEAKVISLKKYFPYVAAIAAILLLVIWAPWNKSLYDQYATTEMIATVERGESGVEAQLQKAAEAFNRKDFQESSGLLAEVIKSDPENAMANYYYGISLLQSDKIPAARSVLSGVFGGESVFKYDAAFYIALSFLKEKNEKECKAWLEKIPEEASVHQKSRELLDKLDL